MLAVPLWVLYELGIVFASMMGKPAVADDDTAATENVPEKSDGGQPPV
jgi:Sec-independent protein secretion pathway component TatC